MINFENITDYKFYIDIYEEQTITLSDVSNSARYVSTDNNGNYINEIISNGRVNINQCTTMTIPNGIILYDDAQWVYIDDTFDAEASDKRFLLTPQANTRYLVRVLKETPTSIISPEIFLDLVQKDIWSIQINGTTINSSNYSYDESKVTLTGTAINHITGINDSIIIYTYNKNQAVTGTATLKFLGLNKTIPPKSQLLDDTFFSDKIDICSHFSDNLTLTTNNTYSSLVRYFEYVFPKTQINRESRMNVTFRIDERERLKNKRFRILAWNRSQEKLLIVNNCYWNDGMSFSWTKTTNEMNLDIEFEEMLMIEYKENSIYGYSIYGDGFYNGQKVVNLTSVVSL